MVVSSVVLIWLQEPDKHPYCTVQPQPEVCLHRLRIPLPKELLGSSEKESSIGTLNPLKNGYTSNLLDVLTVSYINVAVLLL